MIKRKNNIDRIKPYTKDWKHVISPGQTEYGNLFISISYKDNRLSISGVEGPIESGDCLGSCGQIIDCLDEIDQYHEGWDKDKVSELKALWNSYHLNDLRAGTPKQEEAVKEYLKNHKYNYEKVCDYLKSINLYEVPVCDARVYAKHTLEGFKYTYGSAWLYSEVPDEYLEILFNYPETDIDYAWV